MRSQGIFKLSGNFEIEYAGPIDSKSRLETKAELFLNATWENADGIKFIYNGMNVTVYADAIDSNNGLYILLNKDLFGNENSWLHIRSVDGNSILSGDKYSATDSGTFGDISITDDYLYICVLTGEAGNAIWKRSPLFKN